MSSQNHNGSGDNVAGNKLEINVTHNKKLKLEDLTSFINELMLDICHRNFLQAKNDIDKINNIDGIDSTIKLFLKILQIKIELFKNIKLPKKNELLKFLQLENISNENLNLVRSILIHFELRTDLNTARTRYEKLSKADIYTNEVFFEFIATKEELNKKFLSEEKNNLQELELFGLFRGAMRVSDFTLGVKIGEYLNTNFSSLFAKAYLLNCQTVLFLEKNTSIHYFSLKKEQKELISINQENNFIFKGDETLMIFVLLNLPKNSLYYKAKINI